MPERLIRLRHPGSCASCGTELVAKGNGWWDGDRKTLRCVTCGPAHAPELVVVPQPVARRQSIAGRSARQEYERLKARREAQVRARHPHLGGLILAVTDQPQTTTNWAVGAEGERKLGAGLDGLVHEGVNSLHDRLRPGTTANIDHLAVAPSGVWVIDAKRYKGEVAKRDVGGWLSTDVRLFVGRRDCTTLVAAMSKQVAAVRKVLGSDWADVPVRPMLCFVDAEWRWFAKPFELDGVIVTWPKAARALLVGTGRLAPETVERIAARLDEELEPAS